MGKYECILFDSNRFGQVPWTVNIAASEDSQVVGQQLHGDHCEDALQNINSLGNFDVAIRETHGLLVSFFTNDNRSTFSSSHLKIKKNLQFTPKFF